MKFKEALKKLEQNELFHQWKQDNPNHYLAHGFLMKDTAVQEAWQIGYYNRADDRIITFTVDEAIHMNPPSEVFKKDSGVKELFVDEVTSDADEALEKAHAYRLEHYKAHDPIKTIILLQHLQRGQVWNITFVTQAFSVCSIKIDAKTMAVVHGSCDSLLGWGTAVPGNKK